MPDILVKVTRQENAEFYGCLIGDTVTVDFEKYVMGVVASEIGNAGIEACKAQAVAARTFAMSRGVLRGRSISDSSADAQAYRAQRCDAMTYPKPALATEQTSGEILIFGGEPARTIYTASNGGRTVSSEKKWGGSFSYLPEQEDPWDKKAGYSLNGHGVGMSQRGAMWAAEHGVNYRDILAFYYPGTTLVVNYGEMPVNKKAETIVMLAKAHLGCPYVFGALGKENKKGVQEFDCRGFTWWLLHQVGIDISTVGATTQYNTVKDWVERGQTKDIPNLVCPVFMYNSSDKKMSHTGMHIGDGVVIHCTSNGGVKYGSLSNKSWTNYAIPKGLYSTEEIELARTKGVMRTLKSGSSGADVLSLQKTLTELGYDCGVPDGVFGTKTVLAVKMFQTNNGLTADGVVGPLTWAKLNGTREDISDENDDEDLSDTVAMPRELAESLLSWLEKQLK